jgi:cation diffusion facilitator family transporter
MSLERNAQQQRLEQRIALIAVATGIALMGVKLIAYLMTGSAAIFSDAMESIVNIVASGVAFYALRVAHAPPDAEHPYGHGRVEFLSAALEGGMICAAAGAIVIKAVHDLRTPELRFENIPWAIVIVLLSVLGNGGVGFSLVRIGKRASSATLVAGGKHLITDAVTSAAALGALGVVHLTGWQQADPIAALIMGAYLVTTGARMLKSSLDMLMDRQDPADTAMLAALLGRHLVGAENPAPGGNICGYHKLRHRHHGRYHWVDFHITLPAAMPVREAHEIASAIEGEMDTALGGEADATAHIEPCTDVQCSRCANMPSTERTSANLS